MTKKIKFFLIAFAFLFPVCVTPIFAGSLELSASYGTDTYSAGLNYQKSSSNSWLWNFGTAYSANAGEASYEVLGGLGWAGVSNFVFGGGADFSLTPSEKLISYGPSAYVSYRFSKSQSSPSSVAENENDKTGGVEKDSDEYVDESFSSSLTIKLSGGVQMYTNSGLGKKNPQASMVGDLKLTQQRVSPSLSAKIFKPLTLMANYTKYFYSEDIHQFLSLLSSKNILSKVAAGMSSEAEGFLSDSVSLGVAYDLSESWNMELEGSFSTNASDGSVAKGLRVALGWDFSESWSLELGYERTQYPTSVSNLGTFGISNDF